jgi:hypothetical protein
LEMGIHMHIWLVLAWKEDILLFVM